jgi:hypothetical protein
MSVNFEERLALRSFANAQLSFDNLAEPEVEESSTSLQPLGPVQVSVDYFWRDDSADINGIWLDGELIDADAFSPATLAKWQASIEREERQ